MYLRLLLWLRRWGPGLKLATHWLSNYGLKILPSDARAMLWRLVARGIIHGYYLLVAAALTYSGWALWESLDPKVAPYPEQMAPGVYALWVGGRAVWRGWSAHRWGIVQLQVQNRRESVTMGSEVNNVGQC